MTTPTAISAAARWLQDTPVADRPANVMGHLKREFGLTATQAIQAIREANGPRGAE